ncbi:GNAT family N-acetyltransferase [Sutcliffiella rhizosphaerae]|uniref:Spermidine N(1)-acetyltransferase n=1 Tax=Sutcliffiella rhizosphaerae TaxID=2880967 RepID=A0ABM8YUG5_9BACI|nr:GNAT family protein [Sutcliffiella rhizosphaerae]CAG9623625.1 Spermidine N(1)-acetyltransferase [Sutcliffiella rhizosphaerae]
MEPNIIFLSNEIVSLREFTEADWIDVHKYASQYIVCKYQPWGPNTEEDSQVFVNQIIRDASSAERTRFAFAVLYNEKMIGSGEINIRDFTNKVGEVAYIVNPDYWGKGIATDIAKLLINFGFKKLNLHRIYATCDPRNVGSAKVLEKVGMIKEGRIRENLLIKDGWRDSLLYSVLEHEWEK